MSTPLAVKPLYHFTCRDGHRQIELTSTLRPSRGLWPFVWLTTEPVPDFEATGLTRLITTCDRTEFRYVVTDVSGCRPWLGSPERVRLDAEFRDVLEEYGDPQHWWIAAVPVAATWDRSWQREQAS